MCHKYIKLLLLICIVLVTPLLSMDEEEQADQIPYVMQIGDEMEVIGWQKMEGCFHHEVLDAHGKFIRFGGLHMQESLDHVKTVQKNNPHLTKYLMNGTKSLTEH